MPGSKFNRLFPTPQYLTPPVAGIDISDESVKFMELARRRGRLRVSKYGSESLPAGIIESGEIKDRVAFVKNLRELRLKYDLKQVVVSLPEEEAFIIHLSLPSLKPAELRETLELQLEEHIPLPTNQIVFDYELLDGVRSGHHAKERHGYEVGVSAFPKRIAAAYSSVLAEAGFKTLALEIEAQAIARSIMSVGDERLVMIVDFGKTRVSFFIVSGLNVLFTTTVEQIAGEDITLAIQRSFKLDYEQAEKLKIEKGLLVGRQNDLFYILLPIVSVLRDEIIKHYSWWDSRRSAAAVEHGETSPYTRPIEQIIVCGGQATLPGLVDYLNLNLDWPIVLGNPWVNLFSLEDYIPPINLNQSLRYTTSLGLALRSVFSDHD